MSPRPAGPSSGASASINEDQREDPLISHHPGGFVVTRRGKPPRKNNGNQTHLPAFQSQTRAHPRFPRAHEVARRPCRHCGTPCQRSQAPGCLTTGAAHVPPVTNSDAPPVAAFGTRRFGASRRLRRPADYAAVLAAPRAESLRASRHWLSMTAAWCRADAPSVRFGITVGKRNARRAVDRALVKRIVRESSRHAAPSLEEQCRQRGLRLDVAFRLKSPRAAGEPSMNAWRGVLRAEADGLLERLHRHVAHLPVEHGASAP